MLFDKNWGLDLIVAVLIESSKTFKCYKPIFCNVQSHLNQSTLNSFVNDLYAVNHEIKKIFRAYTYRVLFWLACTTMMSLLETYCFSKTISTLLFLKTQLNPFLKIELLHKVILPTTIEAGLELFTDCFLYFAD